MTAVMSYHPDKFRILFMVVNLSPYEVIATGFRTGDAAWEWVDEQKKLAAPEKRS